MEQFKVTRLQPTQAQHAGALFAASHGEYPGFCHVFDDDRTRRRVLRTFMAATAGDAARYGHPLAAVDGDDLLGVALWMPPGSFPLSAMRQVRMTPALIRVMLLAPWSMRNFARLGTGLAKTHPDETAWYLQAMGVHPKAQRRGVGRRLITAGVAAADQADMPCYLQTSDPANVDYYHRYGFEVVQHEIYGYPGGHPYIGMRRKPRVS